MPQSFNVLSIELSTVRIQASSSNIILFHIEYFKIKLAKEIRLSVELTPRFLPLSRNLLCNEGYQNTSSPPDTSILSQFY
jgi:hypothetical protein